jgi:restriction system protein
MPVPGFQSLMLPVLRSVKDGELSASEMRERIAGDLGLSESDLAEMLPSGRQTTFANRVAWANIFLQRAGLLEKVARGVYRISQEGRRVLGEAPERIDMRFLERYPAYVEWRRRSVAGAVRDADVPASLPLADDGATPEEQIERSHTALVAALEGDLLDRVREKPPAFFERLIIDLLVKMGYGGGRAEMGKAVGRAGDAGIDGVIKEDALGLDVVYVQAKRYAADNCVGRSEVQSFAGSLDGFGATKGIFFTTSSFSRGAREFVERISKRIILVDGAELARLMVDHGVAVRARQTFEIKTIDEDYFAD